MRRDARETDEVIVDGAIDRRIGVLADVEPDDEAIERGAVIAPCPFEVRDELFESDVVEAEAVDQGLGARQAEQPRARVAGLRPRRHRSELDEAEPEPRQRRQMGGILVEAGCEPDAIAPAQAEQRDRVVDRPAGKDGEQAGPFESIDGREREPMDALAIEPEQQRPRDPVGRAEQPQLGHRSDRRVAAG